MKKLSFLVASIGVSIVLSSCEMEALPEVEPTNSQLVDNYFKMNYEELLIPLAKTLEDKSSLVELMSFSKLEENAGEVEVNLKDLLDSKYGEKLNQRVEKTLQPRLLNNLRLKEEENGNDLINDFILPNDIEIYAPYLAENFSDKNLESLTITYYYDGMYEGKEGTSNFKAETPGYKFKFNTNGKLDYSKYERVMTNDDYAQLNPTIVLLQNQTLEVKETEEQKKLKKHIRGENMVVGSPLCTDLTGVNEILTIRMPKLKLRKNFRDWPSPNEMYLWVSSGEITTGTNGVPNVGVQTSNPLVGYRVSRNDAKNKTWVGSSTSFIVQNLKKESQDMHIVWGCTRTDTQVNVSASVSVKPDGTASPTYTLSTVKKSGVYVISSTIYDKCALLYNNRYDVNQGFNYFDGYPVYNFNDIWTYFVINKYNY